MRRQAKPFVTEYKASTRRAKEGSAKGDAASASHSKLEASAGESGEAQRGGWDRPESGSFSAAHAAANALFSPRAPQPSAEVVASTSASPAALVAEGMTADLPRGEPSVRPSPAATDAGRSGRILQAIEESAPAAAQIAAEPASERVREPVARRKARNPAKAATAPAEPPAAAADIFANVPPDIGEATAEAVAPTPAERASDAAVTPVRLRPRAERFTWVRKKLRPGERWKRRLPKVAW